MKKIAFIVLIIGVLTACGSSAVLKESRATMEGTWVLNDISYPGNEEALEVTLFEDTSAACLENSEWSFISNNNTGSYRPVKTMCGTQPRFFRWSIKEMEATTGNYDLMLKPTDEDYKSSTDQGFRLNLRNLSAGQMTWEQEVIFEGEPFSITMNFIKKQ